MALAVKAVRGKGMSVRKAAAMYHVPKSSLHDVLTGKHEDDGEFYEKHKQSLNRRLFTDEEEAALASWFRERSSEGESVPMCEAQMYATDLLQAKHKKRVALCRDQAGDSGRTFSEDTQRFVLAFCCLNYTRMLTLLTITDQSKKAQGGDAAKS